MVPGSPVFTFNHTSASDMVKDTAFIRKNTKIYLDFFNDAIRQNKLEDAAITPLLLRSLAQANVILGNFTEAEKAYTIYTKKQPVAPFLNLPYAIFFSVTTGKENSYSKAILKETGTWGYDIKKNYKFLYRKDLPYNPNSIFIFKSSDTLSFRKAVDMRIPFFTKSEKKLTMTEFSEIVRAYSNNIIADATADNLYAAAPEVEKQVQAEIEKWRSVWEEMLYKPQKNEKLFPVIACNFQRFDKSVFSNNQLWKNPNEIENNKIDDDKNGITDDIFGFQFNILDRHKKEPIALHKTELDSISIYKYLQENFRHHPEDGSIEYLINTWFDHGTMAVELMLKNNPTVKIMGLEHNQYDGIYEYIQEQFTNDVLHNQHLVDSIITAFTYSISEMTTYCKTQNVRVVEINVTTGLSEQDMFMKGCGNDSLEAMAFPRKCYKKFIDGATNAYKKSPNTLFVCGAANDNQNVDINPSPYNAIHLPNVLIVGALDKDLHKASYSNYGKGVDVFAPAHFELKNKLTLLIYMAYPYQSSGTSAAAPVVANLAIQLFSLNPNLTASKVKELIIKGSDKEIYEKGINIINPKRVVSLVIK